jgi:threonine dehydratase
MTNNIPTKEDFIKAHDQIKPYIHQTPVLTSSAIDELCGNELYFKCENFQKMGAFKMRGATNAILNLSKEQLDNGVVTHSSGNFAQALSLAAKSLGVKAYIVMPENAPEVKKQAVVGYGGEIVLCESTLVARESTALSIQTEKGATFIHPSNNWDVIIGQGTAGKELVEEIIDLDYLFTPVGGGGLLAGCAVAAHHFSKKTKTIGGEPFGADDAFHSLEAGKIIPSINPVTVADGLRTQLGDINFPMIQKHVSEIVRVEEALIVSSMKLIWERMKIIAEPSSAVALAAIINSGIKGKKIGIVISGGNVDLTNLPF